MSTILKALEKQKSNPQIIMAPDKPWKMMIIITSLIITCLIGLIVFLLFLSKPAPLMTLFSDTPEQRSFTSNAPPIQVSQQESAVTDVTFATKPLPIIVKEEAPLFISPEKAVKAQRTYPKQDSTYQENTQQRQEFADVSDDLKARFARAVAAEGEFVEEAKTVPVNDISQMPVTVQFQVPLMSYDSHVYSTKESERWIRINGIDMRIGDYIGPIELVDIKPQRSVFRLDEQEFTLESLTDWEG